MNTADTLIRIISENFLNHRDDQHLTEDDDLLTTGRINSLGIMRLVMHIEAAFKVTIPPEDVTLENFRSVRLIVEYLDRQRAGHQ